MIPWWLVGLVIVRDLVIETGATVYYFCIERIHAEPSLVSKLNTFAQILLVLAAILSKGMPVLPTVVLDMLVYAVLVTTVWSGLGYVWKWGRHAWYKFG